MSSTSSPIFPSLFSTFTTVSTFSFEIIVLTLFYFLSSALPSFYSSDHFYIYFFSTFSCWAWLLVSKSKSDYPLGRSASSSWKDFSTIIFFLWELFRIFFYLIEFFMSLWRCWSIASSFMEFSLSFGGSCLNLDSCLTAFRVIGSRLTALFGDLIYLFLWL